MEKCFKAYYIGQVSMFLLRLSCQRAILNIFEHTVKND